MLNPLYHMDPPHCAVSVYIHLSDSANQNGKCRPAISAVGKELKFSRSTVRSALRDLCKAGLLETEQCYQAKGGKSSLLYKLHCELKNICRQGAFIPSWWRVVSVMMTGEGNYPPEDRYCRKNRLKWYLARRYNKVRNKKMILTRLFIITNRMGFIPAPQIGNWQMNYHC